VSTLLVLGSAPNPSLPPDGEWQKLACANASGYSAAAHKLVDPTFTVMTAILASGAEDGEQSLRALAGLRTRAIYYVPRPIHGKRLGKRWAQRMRQFRMRKSVLAQRLLDAGYSYDRLVDPGWRYYRELVSDLCDRDEAIEGHLRQKGASMGTLAIAIGMNMGYERLVVAGFSFEVTRPYGENPLAKQRGTVTSKHAETDIAVIGYLAKKFGNIFTSETGVHERAGLPLL
jgi:hypothetical protein